MQECRQIQHFEKSWALDGLENQREMLKAGTPKIRKQFSSNTSYFIGVRLHVSALTRPS